MCENQLSEKANEALAELMASFMKRYCPALAWEQADEHMTSSEVVEMFQSVYPIPLDKIFDALRENGFKCVPLSGRAAFVWLLTLNK